MRARIYFLLFIAVAVGCGETQRERQEKAATEWEKDLKFVQEISVAGICSDDHVGKKYAYEGRIGHDHHIKEGRDIIQGSVYLKDPQDHYSIKDEFTYRPPLNISFNNISPTKISKSEFAISGLSYQSYSCSSQEGSWDCECIARFHATCQLSVTSRSYMPEGLP